MPYHGVHLEFGEEGSEMLEVDFVVYFESGADQSELLGIPELLQLFDVVVLDDLLPGLKKSYILISEPTEVVTFWLW